MRRLLRRHKRRPSLKKTGIAKARAGLFILMKTKLFPSLVAAAAALALSNATLAEREPGVPKKPVSTEYHGTTVEDPYQWLESDDDAEVKAWSDAQNQQTRKYLDSLADRAAIEKQLAEWYAKTSPS